MKEYMFLFRGGDGQRLQQSPAESQAHMQKWMQWMSDMQNKGQLLSAQPLDPGGKQITGVNREIINEPFNSGSEKVGGYLVCKADDYNSAVEIAERCPILDFEDGLVEVREIQEMKV